MTKYTSEDELILRNGYDGTPESVLVLSKTLGRSVPSIRSKLSILKDDDPSSPNYGNSIYISPNAKPKYAVGEITRPTSKDQLVEDIERELVRLSGNSPALGSLTKAGKMDLVNLYNTLVSIGVPNLEI